MTVTSHSPTIPPPPAGEHRPLITCSFPDLPDADLHRVTVDVFGNYRAEAGVELSPRTAAHGRERGSTMYDQLRDEVNDIWTKLGEQGLLLHELSAQVTYLRNAFAAALDRIAAQSELLSQRAERTKSDVTRADAQVSIEDVTMLRKDVTTPREDVTNCDEGGRPS